MATPTPISRSKSRPRDARPETRSTQKGAPANSDSPQVVDPVWLTKAIGITLVAALICGYLTLCLLFYQGQWQLVLHPSRAVPAPARISGAPFQTVHFGVDESATPQLTGWLVPAEGTARYAAYTVLYLPGGDGSLANAVPTLGALHEIGINIFAFDYRGYGQSAPTRPNQSRMTEDAASAWQYLTVSRALEPSHIVLFGDGVGAALAAQLAISHPEAPAVILQLPRPNVIDTVLADPRTRFLPVRALFHENFDLVAAVSILKTPKLFLLKSDDPATPDTTGATTREIARLISVSTSPKRVLTLSYSDFNRPLYSERMASFLDEYLR